MAIMEVWNAIGTPTLICFIIQSQSICQSSDRIRRAGTLFQIYAQAITPPRNWETIMAQAAPGMPHSNTSRNNGSSRILMHNDVARNMVGWRLSPKARKRFAPTRKIQNSGEPPTTMEIKSSAPSRISAGVFIHKRISLAKNQPIKAVITLAPMARARQAAALRRTPSKSLAPNRCPVIMVTPEVRPMIQPTSRNMMLPVQPTAASASTPRNRPTSKVSTKP